MLKSHDTDMLIYWNMYNYKIIDYIYELYITAMNLINYECTMCT